MSKAAMGIDKDVELPAMRARDHTGAPGGRGLRATGEFP